MPKVNPEHEKARRKQILEAALACFMESGFHETTVDDVAAAAELSKGAIYTYFPSKSDLFLGAVDYYQRQKIARARDLFTDGDTAFARLEKLAELFLGGEESQVAGEGMLELEFRSEAFKNPEFRQKLVETHRRWHDFLIAIIEEGVASGEFRSDIDPQAAAAILVATVEGLFLDCCSFADDPDLVGIFEAFVKIVRDGLLAR